MSNDGIQLSPQLMRDLRDAMIKQDPRTHNDVFAMQYLAAAAGLMLSEHDSPRLDKQEVLEDLSGFMRHVFDFMEQQKNRRSPPQQAFGVWTP